MLDVGVVCRRFLRLEDGVPGGVVWDFFRIIVSSVCRDVSCVDLPGSAG